MNYIFAYALIGVSVLLTQCERSSDNTINEDDKTISCSGSSYTGEWKIICDSSTAPSIKVEYAMDFDESNSKIIAYGGRSDSWKQINETWELDLNEKTWSKLKASDVPPWRHNMAIAYDNKRGVFYMFGGSNLNNSLNDFYKYEPKLNKWTKIPGDGPEGRQMHGMEYIPTSDELIVFGGRKTDGGAHYDDTWVYMIGKEAWQKVNSDLNPEIQDHVSMTYVSTDDQVLLFEYIEGSHDSRLWVFDPSNRQWSEKLRSNMVLCDHTYLNHLPMFNVSILFGSNHQSNELETWLFDHTKNEWQSIHNEMSANHIEHADMVHITGTNKLILHGGCCSENTLELEIKKPQD